LRKSVTAMFSSSAFYLFSFYSVNFFAFKFQSFEIEGFNEDFFLDQLNRKLWVCLFFVCLFDFEFMQFARWFFWQFW
jgi:hypothetical protein